MDDCYLSLNSDSEEEVIKSNEKNKISSLEQEFEQLIEDKIRKDHKLEISNVKLNEEKEDELYDADEDDEDEKFIQSLYQARSSNVSNDDSKNVNTKTDATLNCPCCMSLLSLETQRHVTYKNQYRSMFTFNTKIDKDNPVESIKPAKKRRKNKHKSVDLDDELIYYPVSCTICATEVGVYDSNEIYHFYNIIASY